MAMKEMTKEKKVRGKSKAMKVPSKRTMNFAHHKSDFDAKKMVPVILVIVILAAAFVKFGILDQVAKRTMAYEEVSQKQIQLASVNNSIKDYDKVHAQYGRYSYGWMNEAEVNLLSRMDVLKLMEDRIVPRCIIEDIAINDNVLTLNVHGITLKNASSMVMNLERSPIVESASVYSAKAEDASQASIFLSIVMTKEAAENEEN